MQESENYDAWLVDLDGTLYHPGFIKLAMAVEIAISGWRAMSTIRAFRHAHEQVRADTNEVGDPFAAQISRVAAARNQAPSEVERLIREWMFVRPLKYLRPFRRRALLDEITAFRAAGGKTAVVSDYPARDKLGALGVLEQFDTIVASGEPDGPRRLKPHPEGYLAAAERLGVAPERCLIVGDRDDADGAAARAAGMGFRLVR
jgi:phosphoglycolate phosphatase/putative hydrolase of the HAD superfamily